jgi:RNA polymerase sigma-70 factor (ECF subfamily)
MDQVAMPERDEWLMGQVALGRRQYLEPLVRRYAGPLLTFIRRMHGDGHGSEDLFQEVFLAVWCKRKQYQFPRSFKSWLYAIALNKCRAVYRRKRAPALRLHQEGSPEPQAAGETPSKTAVAVETASAVQAAVVKLPTKQRQVVVLRVWNGLSYAEIAEAIGSTEATARSHMHHALAALRGTLDALAV